jgi:hypothetical protein
MAIAQTPKQIPGTEGQKVHEEAAVNSLLPNFQMATVSGKLITKADLPKNKPTVFALFNPTCDHCQHAIDAFKQQIHRFKDVNIVFVTSVMNFADLDHFIKLAGVSMYPNFYICAVQDDFITKFFMPNYILPQIMLFNKQQKLKKIFYETISADSAFHYLHQ